MLGDLYIKTIPQSQNPQEGVDYDLRTGESGSYEYWLDCWKQWGVGLEDGALDVLMTFRANKEPITNKNVTVQGAFYVTGGGLMEDRSVSVPFHIVSGDKADFLLKRAAFYNVIKGTPEKSLLVFKIANPVDAVYKMYYVSCTQYTQFLAGMAKFMLTLYETNGNTDDDPVPAEPMPIFKDMSAYVAYLLETYGGLATEEEVRDIVRNYRFNGQVITRWPLDNR